jgi:uncharacterized membrane protein
MSKGRLEASSDGVIAILITIMVLELRVPRGSDWTALRPLLPVFLTYVLSFVFLGIYWNNIEMRESYQTASARIDCLARYSNFRRFQITTDEVIKRPE